LQGAGIRDRREALANELVLNAQTLVTAKHRVGIVRIDTQ